MKVKTIFGSILAGVLIINGVNVSANAADIAPQNVEHRDHVIELSLGRASGSFNMTVPAKSILKDRNIPTPRPRLIRLDAPWAK